MTKRSRRRVHRFWCTFCWNRTDLRVDTMDLPGGIRGRCEHCGSYTVLLACQLHPDEPVWLGCVKHGWAGERRCPREGDCIRDVVETDKRPNP